MLFVYDDQTEVGQRRENRRARADYDIDVAAGDVPPVGPALRAAQRAVQHPDPPRESRAETIDELRRQRDFGNQDETTTTRFANLLHGAKVDFCLAAAGDAMQKKRFKTSVAKAIGNCAKRNCLLRRERKSRRTVEVRGFGRKIDFFRSSALFRHAFADFNSAHGFEPSERTVDVFAGKFSHQGFEVQSPAAFSERFKNLFVPPLTERKCPGAREHRSFALWPQT